MANMVRTNYFYPKQMLARLKKASMSTGLPVSEIVRRSVDDFLIRMGI